MSPHIGVLGPKAQERVVSFRIGEGETLPQFHIRSLYLRSKTFLLLDETG